MQRWSRQPVAAFDSSGQCLRFVFLFAPSLPRAPLMCHSRVTDCRLRTAACLDQCSNPKASPPVASEANCKASCNYILGSTCGTSNQVLPLYQVKSYNSKPKLVRRPAFLSLARSNVDFLPLSPRYYSDTSKGGVAMGISAARSTFSAPAVPTLLAFALVVVLMVR